MSKRAGKVGTDGREALRAGSTWTPMNGVTMMIGVTFYKEGGKW
jgi:hypothetical protein